MLSLVSVNFLPLVVSVLAWWTELRRNTGLKTSRTILFRSALTAVTLGSLLLVAFVLYLFTAHTGRQPHDFASHAFWVPSALLALLTLPFALFGKGASRLVAVGSSLSLIVMLYLVGLGTSY